MGKKKEIILLYISIGCFFLMSVSFLLMPIDFATKGLQIFNLLIGIMFWVFLLLGIITQFILGHMRKNWFIRNRIRKFQFRSKVGLISFVQNLPACIADGIFVISLIGLIISVIATNGIGYACYIFMALLVFSFCMHCILNGKVYYFLTNQDKILKSSQPKHLDELEKE